jgi:hypothetical protein
MGQQNIECFFCFILFQSNHNSFHKGNVSFNGHLKAETVGKCDIFLDCFKYLLVLFADDELTCQTQVPEFNEQ